MAGQGPERREILKILAIAAAVSQYPGFSRWSFAQEHSHGSTVTLKPAQYAPRFFSPEDYQLLARLTEIVIPTDETPGAREAGVSEFIDFMVWSDPDIQDNFRKGVAWLRGRDFAALPPAQQVSALEHLAYRDRYVAGEEEGQAFFRLLREYTLMGYYTTRIGLEQLDYPGFKNYSESPSCPHKGDPGHTRLHTPA